MLLETWQSQARMLKKLLVTIVAIIFLPLWTLFYFYASLAGVYITGISLRQLGILQDEILIAGTGSMYPTFPKGKGENDIARFHEIVEGVQMQVYPVGISIANKRFFGYELQYGDIISFINNKAKEISKKKYGEETGMVKRVIGLPGDVIEIRNGFVYRNTQLLLEPYTARAKSTYGGTSLSDCQKLTVAENYVFILGDNRIASNDSRHEIGLVAISDIDHVLPFEKQDVFENRWRDASNDTSFLTEPTLDATEYVRLLNLKRQEAGVSPLKLNLQLVAAAARRGQIMLSTDDLSLEATRSGYTMQRAFAESGYSNIIFGESSSLGYFTADELLENSFEFADSKEFLLDGRFDDIGVASVLGDLNGCPTQIVVQHFGGYVPADYSQEEIKSWQELLSSINSAIPSWEETRNFKSFYGKNKKDLDNLLELLYRRREIAQIIISRMQNRQWLTEVDNQMLLEDERIANEANSLIERLNAQ